MTKEKQIEEIQKILDNASDFHPYFSRVLATKIFNAGYRKQSEWRCVEAPPKTYRDEYGELIPFLVCCRGTVCPFRAVYDGTNWGDGIGKLNITHWMPLPEPPKMKGGAE